MFKNDLNILRYNIIYLTISQMGLDGCFIPPDAEYNYRDGFGDIPRHPISGRSGLLRVVDHMPHYNLRETWRKSLRELTLDLMNHIGKMSSKMDEYVYPTSFNKYWTDNRTDSEINLMSDLVIMAKFIGELHDEGIPDDWIIIWDS
jgi:hypothetical protein